MELETLDCQINDIALDPKNPRFDLPHSTLQEEIKYKILNTRETKDLLSSMKSGIKWVNRIVVRRVEDYPYPITTIDESKKYIVVEGNTRLACLMSGELDIDQGTYKCPVLIAKKEDSETVEEYEAAIRITQGIANVMVVKQWSVQAKAKHLYQMFQDKFAKGTYGNGHEIYKEISEELGMTIPDVRGSVIRYTFYKEINEKAEAINDNHWGYLEAFDRTAAIREIFGMTPDFNTFSWDGAEDSDFKLEALKEIPELIKKSSSEGVNSKQFRSIITSILAKKETSEEIYDEFKLIVQPDSDILFSNMLDDVVTKSLEERWEHDLNAALATIESFPPQADFSTNYLELLEKINIKTNKIIGFLKDGD